MGGDRRMTCRCVVPYFWRDGPTHRVLVPRRTSGSGTRKDCAKRSACKACQVTSSLVTLSCQSSPRIRHRSLSHIPPSRRTATIHRNRQVTAMLRSMTFHSWGTNLLLTTSSRRSVDIDIVLCQLSLRTLSLFRKHDFPVSPHLQNAFLDVSHS